MVPSPSTHLAPSVPATVMKSLVAFVRQYREANEMGRVGVAALRGTADTTGAEVSERAKAASCPMLLSLMPQYANPPLTRRPAPHLRS